MSLDNRPSTVMGPGVEPPAPPAPPPAANAAPPPAATPPAPIAPPPAPEPDVRVVAAGVGLPPLSAPPVTAPPPAPPIPGAPPNVEAPPPLDAAALEEQLRNMPIPRQALLDAQKRADELEAWKRQHEPELTSLRQVRQEAEQFTVAATERVRQQAEELAQAQQAQAQGVYDAWWIRTTQEASARRARGEEVPDPPYNPQAYHERLALQQLAREVQEMKQSFPATLQNVLVNHDRAALQNAVRAQQENQERARETAFREGLKPLAERYPLIAQDANILVAQAKESGWQTTAEDLVRTRISHYTTMMAAGLDRNAQLARQMVPSLGAGGSTPKPSEQDRSAKAHQEVLSRWLAG